MYTKKHTNYSQCDDEITKKKTLCKNLGHLKKKKKKNKNFLYMLTKIKNNKPLMLQFTTRR